jgi:hypothetical protein
MLYLKAWLGRPTKTDDANEQVDTIESSIKVIFWCCRPRHTDRFAVEKDAGGSI